MTREANYDPKLKLLTGPDENSDLSKDEDHKKELLTKQSEEADPPEEGREGRKATLREREVVNCTDLHEEGDEEGKATLKEREVVSCCSNKYKTKLVTKQSEDADLLDEGKGYLEERQC